MSCPGDKGGCSHCEWCRGWGKQGHHHPGELALRATVICASLKKIIQSFVGLSSLFTHCCYEMVHNKPTLTEKMQFGCKPRDVGRVANNATCNNQKILVQQTQNISWEHAAC